MTEEFLTPAAPEGGFNLGELMVDEDVSKKGVWVDYLGGSKLLLASTNSTAYKTKLSKLARDNRLTLDDSNPDNFKAIQRITCQALAETVLIGWKGIHWPNESGEIVKNIPYSPALGQEALLKVDHLRNFVSEEAGKPAHFRKEVAELAKKP
jgi:hypothetical protein